jgi:hypothetical protein
LGGVFDLRVAGRYVGGIRFGKGNGDNAAKNDERKGQEASIFHVILIFEFTSS